MAEFPALPLWTDAWLADTHFLNRNRPRRDIYLHLMILMWRTPGCRVPNDRAWLIERLELTDQEYDDHLPAIIRTFCMSSGNWLTQKRLTAEREYVAKQKKRNSDNRKSGWDKKKHPYETDTTSYQSGTTPTPTPRERGESLKDCSLSLSDSPSGSESQEARYSALDGSLASVGASTRSPSRRANGKAEPIPINAELAAKIEQAKANPRRPGQGMSPDAGLNYRAPPRTKPPEHQHPVSNPDLLRAQKAAAASLESPLADTPPSPDDDPAWLMSPGNR